MGANLLIRWKCEARTPGYRRLQWRGVTRDEKLARLKRELVRVKNAGIEPANPACEGRQGCLQ